MLLLLALLTMWCCINRRSLLQLLLVLRLMLLRMLPPVLLLVLLVLLLLVCIVMQLMVRWLLLLVLRRQMVLVVLLQMVLLRMMLVVRLIVLRLLLLQGQRFLQLLRCADTQHLNPVHRTHLLTAVVRVKHEQEVAHPAALRQGEGLRAALVLGCEAAQQLPGPRVEAGRQVRPVLARVAGAAKHAKGVHPAAVELLHCELHSLNSAQLHSTHNMTWHTSQHGTACVSV